MSLFKSKREKRLWLWSLLVLAAIFSTLFIGQPLARELADQNIQAVFFVAGMLLAGAAIVVHGLIAKPSRYEIATLLGIVAVYVMFLFRLGAPERSHLIEYSMLAIFIHKALCERADQRVRRFNPALVTFLFAVLIGVIDECIQLFMPSRRFDPVDILFNGLAVLMGLGSTLILARVRKHLMKSRE